MDSLYARYVGVLSESDILRSTIVNLERDIRALTRENEKLQNNPDTDTEDEDYKPVHKFYHTPSGAKLHRDRDCRYIANSTAIELDVDDNIYEFLLKAGIMCVCDA